MQYQEIMETQTTPNTTKGIEIKDDGNDCKRICCVECGRWVRRDIERIRHASYCESKAQPTPLPAPAAAGRDSYVRAVARQGAVSAVCSEEEILDRVRTGRLSMSDAMNRDF